MTRASEAAPTRARRRDADRNHGRLLDAARAVLGEFGADASVEQIADRAGVGVGTVYRHFPNKEALIDELVRGVAAEVDTAVTDALADDDGTGLERFLIALGKIFFSHHRYAQLVLRGAHDEQAAHHVRNQIGRLVRNAVHAGTVSADTKLGDVMMLIWSLENLAVRTGSISPRAWQRYLEIHLAGLRSGAPLSCHPALTGPQIAEARRCDPPRAR